MKSTEELLVILRRCPPPGLWRHSKTGNVYQVTGAVLVEGDHRPLVCYYRFGETYFIPWARDLSEWHELVLVDGKLVPRFVPCEEEAP